MDIPGILNYLYPSALWSVGEDYASLTWPDQATPKPSEQQLIDAEAGYLSQLYINRMKSSLVDYIEIIAIAHGYSSALSLASYSLSSNQAWKDQSDTFILWRDSVWLYSLGELAKFQAGTREMVTFEEFSAELPVINWPN